MRTRAHFAVLLSTWGALACSTHHHAVVAKSELPPPPGERVLHTDRLVVHVTEESLDAQCVAYKKLHPVCFYEVRSALEQGLLRSLWPSFPDVVLGEPKDATSTDYLLQVDLTLDALPPDDAGPGWSAGARSRFRVLRNGKVLTEETLASRSRAHFAYGAPLAEGATEVIDASVMHVARTLSLMPESDPDEAAPLPRVASRRVPAKSNAAEVVEAVASRPKTNKPQSKSLQATSRAKTETPKD